MTNDKRQAREKKIFVDEACASASVSVAFCSTTIGSKTFGKMRVALHAPIFYRQLLFFRMHLLSNAHRSIGAHISLHFAIRISWNTIQSSTVIIIIVVVATYKFVQAFRTKSDKHVYGMPCAHRQNDRYPIEIDVVFVWRCPCPMTFLSGFFCNDVKRLLIKL